MKRISDPSMGITFLVKSRERHGKMQTQPDKHTKLAFAPSQRHRELNYLIESNDYDGCLGFNACVCVGEFRARNCVCILVKCIKLDSREHRLQWPAIVWPRSAGTCGWSRRAFTCGNIESRVRTSSVLKALLTMRVMRISSAHTTWPFVYIICSRGTCTML